MRRKTIGVLLFLSFMALLIATVEGAVDEWTTATCDEDLFFGPNLFDGVDIVYLQGDEVQVRSWIWFEGPVLQAGRYVREAYLEVYCPGIGATDPDASMTLWGKPSGTGGTPSYYENPSAINGPYTTNFVNVNISSFVGPAYHNITVTNIVREINQGYYFWDGHDIAFTTLSTSAHDEERYIASEESGTPARLYIHYGEPDHPGGVPPEAEYVDEYRNYTIWEVDNLGVNRTGEGLDVNWNILNVTQLTEIDSGSDLVRVNASYMTYTGFQDQVIGCIYNDTGAASIETFFIRFRLNMTNINHAGVGNAMVPGFVGLSTATPVGGGGLIQGANGEWIGLNTWIKDDDQSWRFAMYERKAGVGSAWSGFSQYFDESDDDLYYIEFRANVSGATKWMSYDVYDDPEFTNSINYDETVLTHPTGPFRYAQTLVSNGAGIGSAIWGHYYTYLTPALEENNTIYIVDLNGTIIDTILDFSGNTTDIEDYIDVEVIGYPDPDDPDPPGWEGVGLLSRFNFKLVIFLIGMILFMGTPVYGFAERPEASTWVIILFCMLCGVALLWSLQTM